jgi:glucose-6-phosphate 1-dehydrogenase
MPNPSDSTQSSQKLMDTCTIVIFGATGDLAKRMLVPSIFKLFQSGSFPTSFAVLGVSNITLSNDEFRKMMVGSIQSAPGNEKIDPAVFKEFAEHFYYMTGSFEEEKAFVSLKQDLETIEAERKLSGNRVYYLAVPPRFFSPIIIQLGQSGLAEEKEGCWRRLVIEKPLGHDLASTRELAKTMSQAFKENQIYRIDHYLGKETVQNIMVLRFANGIFEPTWNRRYIDSIQITVAEELGVEHRGSYFDEIGAFRDMVPSHLFQVLALMAMEPPASFGAEAVRDEYKKVLNSVVPIRPEDVDKSIVRGQYGPGKIEDKSVPGYRDEPDVAKCSNTDTYAALRLMIDNWRWSDVPFYLRTGKRLRKRGTEIVIHFKAAPVKLFSQTSIEGIGHNQLILHIQPAEGISLQFGAKVPGPSMEVQNVKMDFKYEDYFGLQSTNGYETLLYDCMKGDPTLFRREDQVELAWQILDPIIRIWSQSKPQNFPNYAAGTEGPKEADDLLARDGRKWNPIT